VNERVFFRFLLVACAILLFGCGNAKSPKPPAGGQVTVVYNGLGTGEVRVGLAKEGCGLDCPEVFGKGAAARLIARPAKGSLFDGFSGPCSGRMPCVVPLDIPRWVAASFRDADSRYLLHVGDGNTRMSAHGFALDAGGGLAVAGGGKIWLGRYDRDGKKLWEMEGGGMRPLAVAMDELGSQWIVGRNDEGAAIEKRGAGGGVEWKGLLKGDAAATDVAVSETGEAIVCGTFRGAVTLGKKKLESVGGQDIFVFLLSPEGKLLNSFQLGGKEDESAPHVAVDKGGALWIAYTQIALDSERDKKTGKSHLVRYSERGELVWDREIGGLSRIDALAPSAKGEVIVAGRFLSTIDAFGKTLQSAGATDAFVVAVDASGPARFARSYGGKDNDEASAVTVDASGNIAVLGTFQHQMKIGEQNLVCKQYPAYWSRGKPVVFAGTDIFLGIFSAEGEPLRARAFGGSGTDFAGAVAFARGGDVVMLVEQEVLIVGKEGGISSILERMVLRRPSDAP